MPLKVYSQKRFVGGISDYLKENKIQDAYVFSRAINYRNDPQSLTLLPGAVKESGSVVTDLIKWGDTVPTLTKFFFYGNSGNIYQRTSAASWSNLHMAASSHGNGLSYFTGDDYLYYTADSVIGRYGPVSGASPQFSDNFLGAQGGVPTNTASLSTVAASSQYATAADSASLSVTGNLTLEAYFKMNSLPTVGNSMTIMGKWDESGALRSYKMDIFAVSGYFGTGGDGSLTISVDTTEAPIDSSCTGTAGTQTLSATNVSFAQGQVILIHQSQGTNAGQWERNTIQGYTAGTITLGTPLIGSYVSGAQVRVMKQYSAVTVNSGKTWSAKAWTGSVGGILANLCSGTITVTGNISATGCGFRGGSGLSGTGTAQSGEGTAGVATTQTTANGNGGGGSSDPISGDGSFAGGGGGSNGSAGEQGFGNGGGSKTPGDPGSTTGSADLTTMVFGGGGGGLAVAGGGAVGAAGGTGGGVVFLTGVTITVSGGIAVNGNQGSTATDSGTPIGNGGSAAAGSVLLKAQTATLGTSLITATGGARGTAAGGTAYGGAGGSGRCHLDYLTSYTGTFNAGAGTATYSQDNTLVTTTTYQARLGISNDGTANEYLSQNLSTLTTGVWNRLSISWTASTSTATFYLNGTSLGTFVGTKTAIHDNASLLYIAANKTSVVANFFDGLLDDIRVWNNVQTANQIYLNNQIQVATNSAGLQAYYQLNSALTDGTANANNLTNHSTTFSSDVPFPASTTRLDIDQSFTTTGQTYTLATAISEASADTLVLTPVNDPQKSIDFNISAKGTGNWTVTIHDQQNTTVASATILNASLQAAGYQEFTFSTPWRIVIGKTYHAHLTSTVADGVVVTSVASNFSNADFHTYFSFLVTDTAFHPIIPFLNFLAIGNERYVGKWDGASYSPNYIAFPPGWRVRCFGFWREYLAIGVWKGTNIYDYPFGRVYFWDGVSATFNFFIDVGDGQINAMFGMDSDLYLWVGHRGYLYDYQGGYFYSTGNTKSNKLKRIPKIADSDYLEVLPGALTMWRNLLHFGVAGASNSTTIQRGVYSWGSYNQNYEDTLSYDYPISTGNLSSTVSIGCIYPAGTKLIVGWQDGTAYGADVVDFANPPARSGTIELLVQDDNAIWKEKSQLTVRGDYLPLLSGESVSVKYKIDRATNWTASTADTTVGSKFSELPVDTTTGRGREYEIAVDLFSTGTTSPTLLGASLLGDALGEEQQF